MFFFMDEPEFYESKVFVDYAIDDGRLQGIEMDVSRFSPSQSVVQCPVWGELKVFRGRSSYLKVG